MNISIHQITAKDLIPLRYAILHPEAPIDQQLQPFDYVPTTRHYGAFLLHTPDPPIRNLEPEYLPTSSPQSPISCFTLVLAPCTFPTALPHTFLKGKSAPKHQIQLRKFAVLESFQGKGIGREFFNQVVEMIRPEGREVLLHLDSRKDMVGFYEKVGMVMLSEEVFVKYGPTGKGKGVKHIKMGMII